MSELVNSEDFEARSYSVRLLSISVPALNKLRMPTAHLSYGFGTLVSMSTISPFNYVDEIRAWSTLKKHYEMLTKLKEEGIITDDVMWEILTQHELMIQRDNELDGHDGEVAVMCSGDLFIADTLNDAVRQARAKHGNRPYYSETINLIDVPSLFPNSAN